MKIYNYSIEGWFSGEDEARESPLEPGVFLIPANATEIEPPDFNKNQLPQFNNGSWTIREHPELVDKKRAVQEEKQRRLQADEAEKNLDYKLKRQREYPLITDQLDALYKARLGDMADLMELDAKITAIKTKYPKAVKSS